MLAWTFIDERDANARASAKAVIEEGAVVPAIWHWEIQNALLTAERRKRIAGADVAMVLQHLASLPIEIEPIGPAFSFGAETDIARRMNLSVYDAAYLDLSLRRGMRLMTRDTKLGAAADILRIRWEP